MNRPHCSISAKSRLSRLADELRRVLNLASDIDVFSLKNWLDGHPDKYEREAMTLHADKVVPASFRLGPIKPPFHADGGCIQERAVLDLL